MLDQQSNRDAGVQSVVLCVDDDPMVLSVVTAILEESGYTAIAAGSGREALEILETSDIDLVVLDYDMPGMKGHEVAIEIRRCKPGVPIILNSGADHIPKAALEAVDSFVPKGPLYRPLIVEIERLLGAESTTPAL